MVIETRIVIWLPAVVLAAFLLAVLMRKRQAKLMELLRTYVEKQLEWSRKRSKAANLARLAAREKAELEQSRIRLFQEQADVPDEKVV